MDSKSESSSADSRPEYLHLDQPQVQNNHRVSPYIKAFTGEDAFQCYWCGTVFNDPSRKRKFKRFGGLWTTSVDKDALGVIGYRCGYTLPPPKPDAPVTDLAETSEGSEAGLSASSGAKGQAKVAVDPRICGRPRCGRCKAQAETVERRFMRACVDVRQLDTSEKFVMGDKVVRSALESEAAEGLKKSIDNNPRDYKTELEAFEKEWETGQDLIEKTNTAIKSIESACENPPKSMTKDALQDLLNAELSGVLENHFKDYTVLREGQKKLQDSYDLERMVALAKAENTGNFWTGREPRALLKEGKAHDGIAVTERTGQLVAMEPVISLPVGGIPVSRSMTRKDSEERMEKSKGDWQPTEVCIDPAVERKLAKGLVTFTTRLEDLNWLTDLACGRLEKLDRKVKKAVDDERELLGLESKVQNIVGVGGVGKVVCNLLTSHIAKRQASQNSSS
ncbi:hypothetical protein BJ508DRAFT_329388 [Ascobolus immersus RN42]|uniref:Uncharacterized protein n=1 Tax=Ascobolus immersus RN42 TaxID=1160509 RepID=A0A3N4I2D0_ASCIM|nr:hypothetical protein BJ508DRAFT_329388 [Ascobolus immersus RN42]